VPITILETETLVLLRTRQFFTRCGMSTAATGSNPDLAGAIGDALRALDRPCANPVQPVDADLQVIGDGDQDKFLRVVLLYTLETCQGRWGLVDMTMSLQEQKLDQLFQQLETMRDMVSADLMERYGFGLRRRRQPKVAAITQGNTWPSLPPPPCSSPPWPPGSTPAPGPQPSTGIVQWGFNP
jgi:hypothetical protein